MTVSTSIGPISGIDYGKLITGLIGVEQQPIDQITTRIGTLDKQNTALLGLSTLITGLKISAANFATSAIFRAASATSGNPNILSATAGIGTPPGNYSFNVQRLASASQVVTQGFADTTSALGLSGTLKIQLGGGKLDDIATLASLNGGSGVARGTIRLTDRSGASSLIDLSRAVDINDVVNTINSSTGVNVLAKLDGDRLIITDNTGGAGTLSVANAGGTTTATDLGLTTAAAGGTLTGTSITALKATTSLDLLNDGRGVRNAGALTDFTITGSTGTDNITLNGSKTISDVITKINAKTSTTGVTSAISADGHGITLTDATSGAITVTAQNSSLAAYDLGIAGTSGTGTLTGDRIASALTGPLLRNVNGGNQGQVGKVLPSFGTVTINAQTIDLSTVRTLDEAVKTLNTNSQGVTAALNNAGTGITLSSSSASFTVANGTGNLASFLNIAGTSSATATGSQIGSGDLRLRYISENTLLSTFNGGTGVKAGKIRITDGTTGSNNAVTLDLSSSVNGTVGDILKRINTSGLALSARVNDTGDGILITQTAGTANAHIEDVDNGTTAKDLGIAGTFAANKLDGSLQETITIAATDKLTDLASKLNGVAGIAASIINDGSGATPFRLNISSRNSGAAGRLIFDGSGAGITTTTLLQGQDASLIFGGDASGKGGLVATGASNTISALVPGLTLSLTGVGATNVAVVRDDGKIKDAVQGFVDSYNKVFDNIADITKYDANDPTNNGVLFANSTVEQVQQGLVLFISQAFPGAGSLKSLASIGISFDQNGKLTLDSDYFSKILASKPDDVRSLFTTNVKAVAGGPHSISSSTLLSSLTSTSFPSGHINITDGFGTAHDIDLSSASTIGNVISAINAGTAGKVTAGLNATGDGIQLLQVGGTGDASVAEVSGGTTAAALNIKGTFSGGALNGALLATLPSGAVKGVGAALSDLLDRFTNAQTGLIFKSSDSLTTQEQQLKDRQASLTDLLNQKKDRLIRQFANLEVTIAGLQQQSTALSNFKPVTTTTGK